MPRIQLITAGVLPVAPESVDKLPHVLLVIDGFPKALGGGERVVLRMAALLPLYGFRVSILTFHIHPESEFSPADAPCPVYLLPLTNTYGLGAIRAAFTFRRFLRLNDVRIVQTFFESSDIWAGFVTRLFSRAKLVWSRRDMGILRTQKHKVAYRALRRFPHAVIAVSARVSEHARTVDRISTSRVHVVHNGLDLPERATTDEATVPPHSGYVVTTIGNIRRVKGHDLLVEAACELVKRHPDMRFTVAGEVLDADYFRELQARVAACSLADRFLFLGKITDLRGHLATADLFVLPSRSEGFSNALVEAMASGLPSIATDVGGNAEAIENGQSGLIIPPEDVNALGRAIETLSTDPELADRLALGGQKAVEEKFSSAAMMRKVVHVFSTVLGE